MPIRYVCLSDMHLGEEDSLLTNLKPGGEIDMSAPGPVLTGLAECLRALLEKHGSTAPKPTLILNGDVLELALSRTDEAVMVFTQFLSLVMPQGGELFDEIIYIPGNHDHHLWETARETQYLNYIRKLPLETPLQAPWHTTKVLMDMAGKDRLVHDFLTGIARRLPHLSGREILTAYPNFGVVQDGRCVVFHHGHFLESIYRLMSTLVSLVFPEQRGPESVYELEGENFAWIDFFWSALGSCGRVGQNMETIYETTGDRKSLQKLTDTLARSIARNYDVPLLAPDWTEEQVLKLLFRKKIVENVAGGQERQKPVAGALPLSAEAQKSLAWYLDGPLQHQILEEHGSVPEVAAFVFGHTHKPFEAVLEVPVFNTGGWVVDTVEPQPQHGGAVTVIDEDLNAVNLRMYNECANAVRVQGPQSTLQNQVAASVAAGGPWKSFGADAAAAVAEREANLKTRLDRRQQ